MARPARLDRYPKVSEQTNEIASRSSDSTPFSSGKRAQLTEETHVSQVSLREIPSRKNQRGNRHSHPAFAVNGHYHHVRLTL